MPAQATDPNAPVGVDPTRASVARDVADLAIENRAFLMRLCRFLARDTETAQYLDCGSGLPAAENTHQVVRRYRPESTVVYVDNDPVVLAHGRALLAEDERTRLIDGDVFEPQGILGNQVVRTHLDWSEPIALFMLATLHHHKGERGRPAEIMRDYVDALPSGSYVAISHILDPRDADSGAMPTVEEAVARGSLGGATARTRDEIQELFAGLEMVEPGLTLLADWWPEGPHLKPLTVAQRLFLGGVGRKP